MEVKFLTLAKLELNDAAFYYELELKVLEENIKKKLKKLY